MRHFKIYFGAVLLSTVIFSAGVFAQDNFLDRVPELEATARRAASGEMGCGPSDYSRVFKGDVKVPQLLVLLNARAESNKTGKTNAMSGEVSHLVYAILAELPRFKDASVIPIVAELLEDKEDVIRGWAAICLIRMAAVNDDFRKKIEPITFPKLAAQSAHGRGVELPTWAKTN